MLKKLLNKTRKQRNHRPAPAEHSGSVTCKTERRVVVSKLDTCMSLSKTLYLLLGNVLD